MEDFEKELKLDFLEESQDLLVNAESAFMRLETERDNPELIDEIFRLAHNLKGTSRAVGFGDLAEVTHKAENVILKIKEKTLDVNDQVVNVLLEFNDQVSAMVDTLKMDIDFKFDTADIENKLEGLLSGESAPAEEKSVAESPETQLPEPDQANVQETASEELIGDNSSSPVTEEVVATSDEVSQEVSQQSKEDLAKEDLAKPEKAKKVVPSKKNDDESIRVNLNKIENLNNIVGELVILQTVLEQKRNVDIKDDLANKSIGQLSKLSKEIQDISMSLRMVPLKQTFQKLSRIVRDTSKALGKEVNLHLRGEETEVDKTVLEQLADPLVHIVRNAVDHGLEDNEDRSKAGKEVGGNVEIMAFHEGSNLVIQVTDDGKGINPDIIRAKAIEKGINEDIDALSDDEVCELIFHPGFSTKEQVTEVSGRGVGMDVVKTNIEGLSGSVRLKSKLGVGSSFKITLPLTMAIIEGMVLKCGAEKFITPLGQVNEFIKIEDKDVVQVTGVGDCFNLRGEVIPIFDLGKQLGVQPSLTSKNEESDPTDFDSILVIVKGSEMRFAVRVDDVLNQQQVVIKKIGEEIKNNLGFMGSSILGDGKPAIILDLVELFSKNTKRKKMNLNHEPGAAQQVA